MTELCSGLFVYFVCCLYYLSKPPPTEMTIGTIIKFWLLYPGLCVILVIGRLFIKDEE